MPRPTSKEQLLASIYKERAALEQFLETLTDDEMLQPGAIGEWSVKDVLAHLIEWEQMVLNWYAAGLRGETPAVPAEGYNWRELPALNQHIYERHRDRSLADIQAQFQASYQQMLELVRATSEQDLFTPGLQPWMRKNTPMAYINSCTSSHYRWARTEMRKGLKRARQK